MLLLEADIKNYFIRDPRYYSYPISKYNPGHGKLYDQNRVTILFRFYYEGLTPEILPPKFGFGSPCGFRKLLYYYLDNDFLDKRLKELFRLHKSRHATELHRKRVEEGTHNFLSKNRPKDENGNDLIIKGEVERGNHIFLSKNLKRDKDGRSLLHIKINESKRINGTCNLSYHPNDPEHNRILYERNSKLGTKAFTNMLRNTAKRSIGEVIYISIFKELNIKIIEQYTIKVNDKWYNIDAYIPDLDLYFESDGFYKFDYNINNFKSFNVIEPRSKEKYAHLHSLGFKFLHVLSEDANYYKEHKSEFLELLANPRIKLPGE